MDCSIEKDFGKEAEECKDKKPHARMRTQEEINEMPGEEVIEKRTQFAKFFSLGESLYQSVLYPTPVHFKDKETGEWKDIDNTFEEGKAEDGEPCLTNRANGGLQVRLTDGNKKPAVSLTNEDGATISWTLEGAKLKPAKVKEKAQKVSAKNEADARRQKPLEANESDAMFEDVLPDTDWRCKATGTTFKDEVIFKTPEAAKPIAFLLNAPGLELKAETNGDIQVLDKKGEFAFMMPAPFMIDNAQETGMVDVSIEPVKEGQWKLCYMPDKEWLSNAAYPVILDPFVISQPTSTGVENNYVTSRSPTTVQPYTSTFLRVAYNHATYATCLAFMKLKMANLPVIDSSYYVMKAELQLTVQSAPTANVPVYLREVLTNWSPSTITYNNKPSLHTMDTDTSLAVSNKYAFDISNQVRKWYTGTNYGFALEARSLTSLAVHSASGTVKPTLIINYTSMAGLEGYLAYESHGAGRAGTAHVGLYNGNLIFTHTDTACNGNLLPVSVSHTYNSCYADVNNTASGYGWKHSMHIMLHREMITDLSGTSRLYYVYTDGDGTRHHLILYMNIYETDGSTTVVYADSSGLSLRLSVPQSGTIVTLTDKSGNVMTFDKPTVNSTGKDSNYKLVKTITDARGNKVTVTSTSGRVTNVQDGAGRNTTFAYDTSNRIKTICAPGYIATGIQFAYNTANQLTTITHEDGKQTTYAYDARGVLTTATNHDGRKLTIEYESTMPYRVKKATESSGTVIGNCRQYTYGDCMTVIKDMTIVNGKEIRYHFNDYGNVVSVSDQLGYAVLAKYSQTLPPNHPEAVSKMQRSVVNLLKNHAFDTASDWSLVGGAAYATTNAMLGTRCLKFTNPAAGGTQHISQAIALEPGKAYVLSCFAKRTGRQDIWFGVQYVDSTGTAQMLQGPSQLDEVSSGYGRIWYAFTLPTDIQSTTATAFILAGGNAGDTASAWIDCAQLEEGSIANHYNMLLNGDFSFNVNAHPTCWTANTGNVATQDKVYASSAAQKPDGLSSNMMRLYGVPTKLAGLYQDIAISGLKDDVFVAGGWANAYSKPRRSDSKNSFNLRVAFKNASGVFVDATTPVEWNDEWTGWQFASGPIIAPADYTAVRYCVDYELNVNYAEFDGLFLYKERFGKSFTYDTTGNVLATKNLTGTQFNATYDGFNNLTSYQQPGMPATVKTTLSYGTTPADLSKRLLKKATSPTGITQSYTYDTKGNPLTARTSNAAGSPFIQGTTAYTANANYVASTTDARGKTVQSSIDLTKGTLSSVTDPNGQSVSYTYDTLRRVTGASATADSKTYKNAYVYEDDKLKTVSHNTESDTDCDVTYSFAYDELGNRTTVKVGDQVLSTTTYTTTGDKLPVRVESGNGGKVHYERDEYKRVIGIRYDNETTPRYRYGFDANGSTASVTDTNLGRVHTSEYDLSNRPMRGKLMEGETHLYTSQLTYDVCNRVTKADESVGTARTLYTTSYAYDNENRATKVAYNGTNCSVGYGYDTIGRMTSRTLAGNTATYNYATTYGYVAGGQGTNSTTALVSTITQPGQSFSYAYDNVGNITSETRNGVATTYAYDGLGQLIRVNDPNQNQTYTFEYDRGGNILSKSAHTYTTGTLGAATESVAYTYGDPNWKDKLTCYAGLDISYDAIGNPLYDSYWNYEWQAGRQLKRLYTDSGNEIKFTYDANGLRIKKESSLGTTKYTLAGANITHMTRGTVDMHFYYDAQGKPAMVRYNGSDYYYVYNVQGDVVAILEKANNNAVCVEYKYDAWGKQVSCTGTKAATVGKEQPFRYRGYVYDEETGWYYLRSRYYDPGMCRFGNADVLLTRNMFAYCYNIPVMKYDPSGMRPVWELYGLDKEIADDIAAGSREPISPSKPSTPIGPQFSLPLPAIKKPDGSYEMPEIKNVEVSIESGDANAGEAAIHSVVDFVSTYVGPVVETAAAAIPAAAALEFASKALDTVGKAIDFQVWNTPGVHLYERTTVIVDLEFSNYTGWATQFQTTCNEEGCTLHDGEIKNSFMLIEKVPFGQGQQYFDTF